MNRGIRFFAAAALLSAAPAIAGESPRWVTEGPYANEASLELALPLTTFGNLLFVDVEIGGKPRRFLLDTGSPSMMSRELADALGLEAVDQRQGRDGQGTIVTTDVVQADFTLDGTTFHKVPVFVTDFPKPPRCLFDGVLGSEVLPLCAWQIDIADGVLRCHSDVSTLDHIGGDKQQALHDFGYPHAPILDIALAEDASSKALFDTGSQALFTISPPDFEGARRNGGVAGVVSGEGSPGGSIGGAAPAGRQKLVQLASLEVGDVALGEVDAVLRAMPPSLVGAALLQHFVVTLDSKHARAWFDRVDNAPLVSTSYGFTPGFDDGVTVSMVWDDSPADDAGLRVGQRLTAINGEPAETSCEGVRRALTAMTEGNTIELSWEGGEATLTRRPLVPAR